MALVFIFSRTAGSWFGKGGRIVLADEFFMTEYVTVHDMSMVNKFKHD